MSVNQLKLSERLLGLSSKEEVLCVLVRWRVERMVVVPLPVVGCDLHAWGKEVRLLKLSEEVIRSEGLSLGVELSVGWEEFLRGRRGRPRSEALEVVSESDGVDVFGELLEESGEILSSVNVGKEAGKEVRKAAKEAAKAEKEAAALAKKELAAAAKAEKEAQKAAKKAAAEAQKAAKKAAAEAQKAEKKAAAEAQKAEKKAAAEAQKAEKKAAAEEKKAAAEAQKAEKKKAAEEKKAAADAQKAEKKKAAEEKKNKESKPAPELLVSIGVGPLKNLDSDGELCEEAYEDEEEVSVRVFEHGGAKWLKDDAGCIYDPESHEEVGQWNEAEQKVVLCGVA